MEISLQENRDFSFQVNPEPVELEAIVRRHLESKGRLLRLSEISGGLFNTAYRIELADPVSKWILRVSPHPAAEVFYNERHLLEREASVAKTFASLGGVFPQPLVYDLSRSHIDRCYSIHEALEGELWDGRQAEMSPAQNNALWSELGAHAKRIHAVTGESFGYPAPAKSFAKWSEFIFDEVDGMVANAERLQVPNGLAEARRFQKRLRAYASVLDEIKQPYLCHGDLWAKNVLFQKADDGSCSLSGLLDCERAFWGDRAAEWVLLFLDMPEAFWSSYGQRYQSENDLIRCQLYRGMHYILSLLEDTRFGKDGSQGQKALQDLLESLQG